MRHSEIAYNITALVTLFPTELGGRKKPIYTGYKPAFAFSSAMQFSGEVELLKKDVLEPGQSSEAIIHLLPSVYIRQNLKSGDSFTILEGSRQIGTGVIRHAEKVQSKGFVH